jgi:hypothetical protein
VTPDLAEARAYALAKYAVSALQPLYASAELRKLLDAAFACVTCRSTEMDQPLRRAVDRALAQIEYEECRDAFDDLNLEIDLGGAGLGRERKASLMVPYDSLEHGPKLLDYAARLSRVAGLTHRGEALPLLPYRDLLPLLHSWRIAPEIMKSSTAWLCSWGCFNIARDLETRNLPGDARIVRVIRLWLGTDPFQIGRSLASLPGILCRRGHYVRTPSRRAGMSGALVLPDPSLFAIRQKKPAATKGRRGLFRYHCEERLPCRLLQAWQRPTLPGLET